MSALPSCSVPAPVAPARSIPGVGDYATAPTSVIPADAHAFRREVVSRFAMTSIATGNYEVKDDFLGKDESGALMFRGQGGMMTDRGIGAGIDVKFIMPYDDFYENSINRTALNQFDIYPFFLVDPMTEITAGRFRMPVRIGPYFSTVDAEFTVTGDETDYDSFGGRIEIHPELVLSPPSDEFEASMFARLSAGLHYTEIHDDSTNQHYYSSGYTLGVELGMRLVFGRISLSSSYIRKRLAIRESDIENGLFIPGLETDFEGVQFSLGVSF